MPTLPTEPYLSSVEASKRFGITNDYIGALCRRGTVRGVLVGRLWFVDENSLKEHLDRMQAKRAAQHQVLSKAMRHAWASALVLVVAFAGPQARASGVGMSVDTFATLPDAMIETTYNAELAIGRAYWQAIDGYVWATQSVLDAAAATYNQSIAAFVDSTYAARDLSAAAYGGIATSFVTNLTSIHESQVRSLNDLADSMADGIVESGSAYDALRQWYTDASAEAAQRLVSGNIQTASAASAQLVVAEPTAPRLALATTSNSVTVQQTTAPDIAPASQAGATTVPPYVTQNSLALQLAALRAELRREISAQQSVQTPTTPSPQAGMQVPQQIAAGGYGAVYNAVAAPPTSAGNIISQLTAADIPALNYFPATSTISVAYGGTGTSTAPSYGQVLLGNALGGYDLVSTSSLGIVGGGTSSFSYPFPSNATSTLLAFSGGLTAYASSTLGDGTPVGGLTISGGATSTLGFNIASSTLGLSLNGTPALQGSTTLNSYFFGGAAMSASLLGTYNYAIGQNALANATSSASSYNIAIGYQALKGDSTNFGASYNLAIGRLAGSSITTGSTNIFIGDLSGLSNTSGAQNNFIGNSSGASNTIGNYNNFLGSLSGYFNTSGQYNNFFGYYAGKFNTTGSNNTYIGYFAGILGDGGSNNIGIGSQSLENVAGSNNVALGSNAGYTITSGYSNIMLGDNTQTSGGITTGSGNVGIGPNVFFLSATANRQLNIGNLLFGTLPATSTAFKLPTSGAIGIGTTSPFAKLSIALNNGDTTQTAFAIGSSTAAATTTLFAVSNTGSTTIANGVNITAGCFAVNGACLSTGGSSFSYPFPSNATSTLLAFSGGLTSYASSTIGNGADAGGLTINGGATTTGNMTGTRFLWNPNAGSGGTSKGKLYLGPYTGTNCITTYERVCISDNDGYNSDFSFIAGGGGYTAWNLGATSGTPNSPTTWVGGGFDYTGLIQFWKYSGSAYVLTSQIQGTSDGSITFNSSTGGTLKLAYNAVNGNPSTYAKLAVDSSGNLNITNTGSGKVVMNYANILSTLNFATTATSSLITYQGGSLLRATGTNLGLGLNTLPNNSGGNNTALGSSALNANTSGNSNTALGQGALSVSTTGFSNVGVGYLASGGNVSASTSVAVGVFAANGTGGWTYAGQGYTAVGYNAGGNFGQAGQNGIHAGDYSTLFGYQAGRNISTGYANILVGSAVSNAAMNITSGNGNVGLGNELYFPSATASNQLNIGNFLFGTLPATSTGFVLPTSGALGIGTSSPFAKLSIALNNGDTTGFAFAIGSSTAAATTTLFSVDNTGLATFTGSGGTCTINGAGACTSDERLKTNITDINGSDALQKLALISGVTYNWADPALNQNQRVGVIAQDVLKAFPQLVGSTTVNFKGTTGTYYTVDYAGLTAPLISAVNELNLDLTAIASDASTTPQSQSFAQGFFNSLYARLTGWFADASNGIQKFFAKEVHTQQLCVGDSTGAETCVTKAQLDQLLAGAASSQTASTDTGSTASSTDASASSTDLVDTEAPVIVLNGAASITIDVHSSYIDLGATVTDNVNKNLGYQVSLDGGATSSPETLLIDTSVPSQHTIMYTAVDQAGNIGYNERTITVAAPLSLATSSPAVETASSTSAN